MRLFMSAGIARIAFPPSLGNQRNVADALKKSPKSALLDVDQNSAAGQIGAVPLRFG